MCTFLFQLTSTFVITPLDESMFFKWCQQKFDSATMKRTLIHVDSSRFRYVSNEEMHAQNREHALTRYVSNEEIHA